ncbi:MAG: DUF192 domain-containing protein [Pseudomonadota bacterium]
MQIGAILRCAAFAVSVLTATACAQDTPNEGLETMAVNAGTCRFVLEKATTPQASATGLMHRESMPADRGMVFPIRKGARAVFWMKNTLIPLDIAFLSEDWEVLAIKQMYPLDLTNVPGPDSTRIAVEVNQGRFEECGVSTGDQITAAE